MPKQKEVPGYVFCSLCDIYYSKKLFDKAEEEKAKRLKSKDEHIRRMAHNITGCPMCRSRMRETILSLAVPSGDCHRLRERPFSKRRISKPGPRGNLIFIDREKK